MAKARKKTTRMQRASRQAKVTTKTGRRVPRRTSASFRQSAARLKGIITPGQKNPLTSYWTLGHKASKMVARGEVNRYGEHNIGALADAIGVQRDTLHLCMKFSRRAKEAMVKKLEARDIAWRGVVKWLGVRDEKEFQRVYNAMLTEVHSSPEIDRYIRQHAKTQPQTRIRGPLPKACDRWAAKVDDLVTALAGFGVLFAKCSGLPASTERTQARNKIRGLERRLVAARDAANSALRKIRKMK